MRKLLYIFLIFLSIFAYRHTYAELEFSFGDGMPYSAEEWTSPEKGSSQIFIQHTARIEPVAEEYIVVPTRVREIIEEIITQFSKEDQSILEKEQYAERIHETLTAIEDPKFTEYIITAINSDTEKTIEEKLKNNIKLNEFEETFLLCDIPLEERQKIVLDILERIESEEIESIDTISYSDPRFGDCIIPYPDIDHKETLQEVSFQSNKDQVMQKQQKETIYEVEEHIQNLSQQEKYFSKSYKQHKAFIEKIKISSKLSYELQEELASLIEQQQEAQTYSKQVYISGEITQSVYEHEEENRRLISELQTEFFQKFESHEIQNHTFMDITRALTSYAQSQKNQLQKFVAGEIIYDDFLQEEERLKRILEEKIHTHTSLKLQKKLSPPWYEVYRFEALFVLFFASLVSLVYYGYKKNIFFKKGS